MKTRIELKVQLIENRLMRTYEETEFFEDAMNELYKENDLENIAYFCEAFDDDTEHHEVMFGMIHGIENYDNIFSAKKATKKLIDSVEKFNNNSKEWQETVFLRIANNIESRELLKVLLKVASTTEKKIVTTILKRVIEIDRNRFELNVNYILSE